MRGFYPTACQQTGSVLLRVGTQTCPQLRLTTALNHTRVLVPSNNPSPEAFLLSLVLPVGEAAPLLLVILRHGHRRRPADHLLDGEGEAAAVVVVDGVDGVGDHKWSPTKRLSGLVGEVAVVVTTLGLNLLPRLFITKQAVVAAVPQPP